MVRTPPTVRNHRQSPQHGQCGQPPRDHSALPAAASKAPLTMVSKESVLHRNRRQSDVLCYTYTHLIPVSSLPYNQRKPSWVRIQGLASQPDGHRPLPSKRLSLLLRPLLNSVIPCLEIECCTNKHQSHSSTRGQESWCTDRTDLGTHSGRRSCCIQRSHNKNLNQNQQVSCRWRSTTEGGM
jgi:hypothetical protein